MILPIVSPFPEFMSLCFSKELALSLLSKDFQFYELFFSKCVSLILV